ncbi:MAG: 4Fe-4S dicluster domain-containing protein [Proteobacteria bacterium]|nr:4Fe-4S dicluster domain-containing protein [Pseudomonadota bacterium]
MDSRYHELAERIDLGRYERIVKLFSIIASPAEADLMLAMPSDVPALAEKTGRPLDEVQDMVDKMFLKGLVFPSKKTDPPTWRMVRSFGQFHDATILWPEAPREFLDLWQEWIEHDWIDYARPQYEKMARPAMRVIPVGVQVEAKAQVLAFEDVEAIINNARELAVTPCTCRVRAHKCDHMLEACIQIDNAASYAVTRGTGRALTKEEAVDLIRQIEEDGLIHTVFNMKSSGHVICNCCSCCCMNFPVLIKYGLQVCDPSRFRVSIDPDLCTGCETCIDRCFFGVIEMADDLAQVAHPDKCLGCGVCQVTCPSGAISMVEVRSQDYIPEGTH